MLSVSLQVAVILSVTSEKGNYSSLWPIHSHVCHVLLSPWTCPACGLSRPLVTKSSSSTGSGDWMNVWVNQTVLFMVWIWNTQREVGRSWEERKGKKQLRDVNVNHWSICLLCSEQYCRCEQWAGLSVLCKICVGPENAPVVLGGVCVWLYKYPITWKKN